MAFCIYIYTQPDKTRNFKIQASKIKYTKHELVFEFLSLPSLPKESLWQNTSFVERSPNQLY